MPTNNPAHTLQAWTKEGDFVPTLYIEGEIGTNGEKPVVKLNDADSPENNSKELLLKFVPDVYDPAGASLLKIANYSKPLKSDGEYDMVTIQAARGNINLKIGRKRRSES